MNDILNPTFTSRETYLAWRAAWRAAYRELSQSIRANKRKRRELMQAGEHAGMPQWTLHCQRQDAAQMMNVRAEATIKARQQRAATATAA